MRRARNCRRKVLFKLRSHAHRLAISPKFCRSVPRYDTCRTRAKFCAAILLICLELQNAARNALLQRGKVCLCGTRAVQIRKETGKLWSRACCGVAGFQWVWRFFRPTFEVTVQARSSNSQDLRRPQAISLAHIENPVNVHLAHFFQGQRAPIVTRGRARATVL